MGLHISEMEPFVAKRRFQEIRTDLSILKDRLYGMGLIDEAKGIEHFMDRLEIKGKLEVAKLEEIEKKKMRKDSKLAKKESEDEQDRV